MTSGGRQVDVRWTQGGRKVDIGRAVPDYKYVHNKPESEFLTCPPDVIHGLKICPYIASGLKGQTPALTNPATRFPG